MINWKNRKKMMLGVAIALLGISALSRPAIALLKRHYALFRPYAYSNYPYRPIRGNQKSGGDDVFAIIKKDPRFKTFTEDLERSGLKESFKKEKFLTVFVPTNAAYRKDYAIYSQLDTIELIKYHIVTKPIDEKDQEQEIITSGGKKIKISHVKDSECLLINDKLILKSAPKQPNPNPNDDCSNSKNNTEVLVVIKNQAIKLEDIKSELTDQDVKGVIIVIDQLLIPPNSRNISK